MKERTFRVIKKGLADGIKSIAFALNLDPDPRFDYNKPDRDQGDRIHGHFASAGNHIRVAMGEFNAETEEDHASYDARQSYLNDERNRTNRREPERPPFLRRVD